MSNRYKICIYAICKNEEKFVDRWMENAKEADQVIGVDTGSTDGTIDKLNGHGAEVHNLEIHLFQFDHSRNYYLI